jgi:hypothetical protein
LPALQLMTCPVMKLASSARNAMAAACSSGSPRRRALIANLRPFAAIVLQLGALFRQHAGGSLPRRPRSVISVPPGATMFTRMP